MSVVWVRVCCDGSTAACGPGYYSGIGRYVQFFLYFAYGNADGLGEGSLEESIGV